jgi:hypothetical protein
MTDERLALRRWCWGFAMGDCLTRLLDDVDLVTFGRFRRLDPAAVGGGRAASPSISTLGSTGDEVATELAEVLLFW